MIRVIASTLCVIFALGSSVVAAEDLVCPPKEDLLVGVDYVIEFDDDIVVTDDVLRDAILKICSCEWQSWGDNSRPFEEIDIKFEEPSRTSAIFNCTHGAVLK